LKALQMVCLACLACRACRVTPAADLPCFKSLIVGQIGLLPNQDGRSMLLK
jgi:hypothetical protein